MKTLITGSMAYDTIMVFQDHFKNHILPEQTHMINVSFLAPEMTRFRGGCAGNIAYTLNLLGGDPVIMATVGDDFGPYGDWLDQQGLSQQHVTRIQGQFTAQAFITTDIDNNQIAAFHPGAMNFAHHNKIGDANGIELGVIAPDGREAMLQHAAQFAESGIPYVFDPGQGMPLFSGEELINFMDMADYAVMNDYESRLMADKTGLSLEQLAGRVNAMIVTHGGDGSQVHTQGETIRIGSAPISEARDPTGCGDAYRAGLLYGLARRYDWKTCGQIGAVCGAIKIEHGGTQSHHFDMESFAERYSAAFGEQMPA